MKAAESLSQQVTLLRQSADAVSQLAWLKKCGKTKPGNPAELISYIDTLLFILAYPFSEENRLLALSERERMFAWLESKQDAVRWQRSLEGSGLPFTHFRCQFSLDLADWFLDQFPGDARPDITEADKRFSAGLMQAVLPGIEFHDTTQGNHTLWNRIRILSGHGKNRDGLKWLIRLIREQNLQPVLSDMLYDPLKIYVSWRIGNPVNSRPGLQWPVSSIFYRAEGRSRADSVSIIRQKIGQPIRLKTEQKYALITLARLSLACYYRETDPVTYADPEELFLFDMGDGLLIALMGMKQERLLALESYIGFMAFKNGIPISYGGGWIFGHRCKIGVNIYPPFRGAGSDHLFCQVMRLYHQRFQVKKFVVKPYQFGKGNPEGLASGAFWFYYRLGFRPIRTDIREKADKEWEKIRKQTGYRTPLPILRSFTACNKEWVPNPAKGPIPEADKVSVAVTRMICEVYGGNRKLAIQESRAALFQFLGKTQKRSLQTIRPSVLDNWSLVLRLLPGKEKWKYADKKQWIQIMKARSSGPEWQFIRGLQQHTMFWKGMNDVLGCREVSTKVSTKVTPQ